MILKKEISIYVHYPFCISKCPYCDFVSYPLKNQPFDIDILAKTYKRDLSFFKKFAKNKKISSIYFGGGTPSLMDIPLLLDILDYIKTNFTLKQKAEITIEINPKTFSEEKLKVYKLSGINRISLGVQSLYNNKLKFLGRIHNKTESIKAIEIIHKYFENFSADLMYSLPDEKIKDLQEEICLYEKLKIPHISAYQLTIEPNTPFFKRGIKTNEAKTSKMFDTAKQTLEKYGYINYEISNFAQQKFQSLHNLNYWNGGEYIGVGASAHSRVYNLETKSWQAITMPSNLKKWIEKKPGLSSLTNKERAYELLMLGLRKKDGINIKNFKLKTGIKLVEILDLENIKKLQNENLIEYKPNETLKILNKGWSLLNTILVKIIN